MQSVKFGFLFLVLAAAVLFMPHAQAACNTPDMPAQINVAAISVSTNLPVGATIPGSEKTVHVAGNCDKAYESGKEIIACYYGSGNEIPGMTGVYDSGVPGIGVALMNDQNQRISGAGGTACDSRGTPIGYISSDGMNSFNFDVTLELVKTSNTISSGSLSQAQTIFGIGVYANDGIGSPNTIDYAGNIDVKSITCSVNASALTVILGDNPTTLFSGIGSTGRSVTQNIDITCNNPANVAYTVNSGNGFVAGAPGVINLTQENDVASGIGVQMLVNNRPITPGSYASAGQITTANGTLTLPLTLQYYQTADQITPGAANSVATITLGYQ